MTEGRKSTCITSSVYRFLFSSYSCIHLTNMYWVFINMDNVSDVSVYFPKTFGCSCDRLNTNPLKSFTGFGMSYSHWVFSGSVDARSSFSSWTCIKTVNTFKMCSYTGKCGNICKRRLTNRGSIATPKGVAFVGWQSGVCRQGNQGDMVWGGELRSIGGHQRRI